MVSNPPNSAGAAARRWLLHVRRGLLALCLSLAVLAASTGEPRPSALDLAMAPHRYSILAWELNHLPHKWTRQLGNLWPGRQELDREEQTALVQEFFSLGSQRREIEGKLRRAQLAQPRTGSATVPAAAAVAYLEAVLARNQKRQAELLPRVEDVVEGELSRVLAEEGLTLRWAGVFPPVDVVFGSPPAVLTLSPRDRIHRQRSVLMRPGLSDATKAELETLALTSEDLSAVVEGTGGLAVYPSLVLDTAGLRFALEAAAHEWVHHWLFFRPLGRNYHSSPELQTINETAATIVGEELGDRVYTALTGEAVSRPWVRSPPGGFDFNAEMRQTRREAERRLALGDIAGAEAYMEERRRFFVASGYNIRKINQAYFAFYGAYATGPGSVSPIGGQLRDLRQRSASLKDFLDTVARLGSYEEFAEFWDQPSIKPPACISC